MFGDMSTAQRVQAAMGKSGRVVDQLISLLALHENNAIIVYSDALASQIPPSYATYAYDLFRQVMYGFEIIRLCAVWDRASADRDSIPSIVKLIEHPAVTEALIEKTRAEWSREREDAKALKRAEDKAAEARAEIPQLIAKGREIENSTRLESVRKMRDWHLAHSLFEMSPAREKKANDVFPMKYGDERKLLLDSVPLVERLHLWVTGGSFTFDKGREMARRDAEALWKHCTFNIQN